AGSSGLAQLLIQQGAIDRQGAKDLQAEADNTRRTFYRTALGNSQVDNDFLYRAAAEAYGIPFFDLGAYDERHIPETIIPASIMEEHQIAPLYERGSRLFVAVADPSDIVSVDAIRFHTSVALELILVEESKILSLIEKQTSSDNTALLTLDDDAFDELDIGSDDDQQSSMRQEVDSDVDTPIVRFVNKMFLDAINQSASDIHVEPYEKVLRIRYRIDGVLHEVPAPPVAMANQIISRIKILSRLDIAERRVPQDGRMKLKLSKTNEIDFRISTLPTLFGEKIVIRILDTSAISLDLEALGFEPDQLAVYADAIKRPYGMILVTGPTGSGKSISLYSALNMLNTIDRNISSVEDPVEVYLTGINQVAINEKANLNFAVALRAFLRQDPDIIMVGEIRDLETADIAIKASQTGHLVLSTLHTNDALATVTRLLNMGVEPFNVGSSVHLIMAQRLLRKLCPSCKQVVEIPQSALLEAGFRKEQLPDADIHQAVGCNNCTNGYKGRTGIFQLLLVSEEMSFLIMGNAKQEELEKLARKEGMITLRQAGLIKVAKGLTTLDEVERVTNL
ncbi:MAG: type IV pilus assembly protein PilB, partial [Parasphingorhabdus sp.]